MKKTLLGFILGIIVCIGFQALAATTNIFKAEKAYFDILVNGEKFTNTDKPAVVIEGSTYLPLRAMGNALNVPVEWNTELKRVEVGTTEKKAEAGTPKIETKYNLTVKSNTLKFAMNFSYYPVLAYNDKYYVLMSVFNSDAAYIKSENDNYYLKLPGKDSILIKQGNTVTDKAISKYSYTYIDIEACGLKYTLDGDVLWVEM